MEIETLIILALVVMLPVALVVIFIGRQKKGKDFEEFNPVPFKKVTIDAMKDKMKMNGKKVKNGSLLIGFEKIPFVDRFYQTKGVMPVTEYDEKNNNYKSKLDDKKEPVTIEYNFLMFRVKSDNLLLRLLGVGKSYFLINNNIKTIVYFPFNCTWKLPNGIDLINYGGIWIENVTCGEYLNNIGIMEMNQQLMTAVLNYPNKIVHLEAEQAKKERTNVKVMELEKAKYDNVKSAGDTTVS